MLTTLNPRVSIVIASHRKDSIEKCLEGFSGDIAGFVDFEIIAVADYSFDDLKRKYPEINWKYHNDKNIPAKRNIGISCAKAPITGFIDDDCVPLPDWIIAAAGYLEQNSSLAGVAGHTVVEVKNGVSYPLKEFLRLEKPGFRTNNIFYRKDIILKAGGFDERFTFQREDIDLAFTIMDMGVKIGYCPDVKVMHLHRDKEYWDLLKNCRNRRFDPLLYNKHPAAYRKWIGTPLTPAIIMMTLLHAATLAGIHFGMSAAPALLIDTGCALILGIRKNNSPLKNILRILRDGFSYFIAPLVMFAALIYGSIKFRRFLLA
ncbi:MAG TPA: hypothetical protein DCO75_06275 [Fibrobacteres bacterium]|jgi:glycosyltransferase involved in cell wall biosynthesis|nr:hypothetical protein [Fibrobacterota bacterium]